MLILLFLCFKYDTLLNMNSPASDSFISEHGDDHRQSSRISRYAQLLFVLFALSLIFLFRDTPQFHTLGIVFVSIVLEAMPFMLLGTLIGGFIEVFVPREKVTRWLPEGRWWTVFIGAGIGILFPVCECAIVPVVRKLLQKGVPFSAAIAFLLGGPIVNPLVAASTAVAYFADWTIVMQRMLFGYCIAVGVGLLMGLLFSKTKAVHGTISSEPDRTPAPKIPAIGTPAAWPEKIGLAVNHAAGDFLDIGRFLIIGAFCAAVVQTLVPRQVIVAVMDTPGLSILIMMLLAVLLNLCSEADAFIAASFRSSQVPPAAQMAFMVLGPMLDIKLILMYLKVFRVPAIAVLASLTFLGVFLSMVVMY
jgi:uncharacterized membrane protein YraQ (UPF0718 family)